VLDDGLSWQGASYRSLSALARKDHRDSAAEGRPAANNRRLPRPSERFAPDSALEGNGFELSVPRCLATANSVGVFMRR
jgi:hypothetical protein